METSLLLPGARRAPALGWTPSSRAAPILSALAHPDDQDGSLVADDVQHDIRSHRMNARGRGQLATLARHAGIVGQQIEGLLKPVHVSVGLLGPKSRMPVA
jgi:hypothetical protein